MGYSSKNRRTRARSTINDRNLRLDNKLDSHQKPVKIGDNITGLQLAGKDVKVEGTLTIDGDSTIGGDTTFVGSSISTVAGDLQSGMILGYTRIQNDGTTTGQANITVNSSDMTVLQTAQGTDLSIQFIAPPSGNVEIECSFWMAATSDGAKFSLSSDSSYAELDETHTYDADSTVFIDETDHAMYTVRFAVSGLTAGTNTTYYLAGLATGGGVLIIHGRNRTGGTHYPPIILKAIALPSTITTGE